jgi:hypothetical protein
VAAYRTPSHPFRLVPWEAEAESRSYPYIQASARVRICVAF